MIRGQASAPEHLQLVISHVNQRKMKDYGRRLGDFHLKLQNLGFITVGELCQSLYPNGVEEKFEDSNGKIIGRFWKAVAVLGGGASVQTGEMYTRT